MAATAWRTAWPRSATSPMEGFVTEVPEHLLARSRARREAAGLATPAEGGAAPAPGGTSEPGPVAPAAPAATPAPATAPPPPPPPKPDPPYIQAYKNRRRIPF